MKTENDLVCIKDLIETPIGHSLCDMHYGSPFSSTVFTVREEEVPQEVAFQLIEGARLSAGKSKSGYTNKMLTMIAKDPEEEFFLLAYNYDFDAYLVFVRPVHYCQECGTRERGANGAKERLLIPESVAERLLEGIRQVFKEAQ